MQHVPLEWFVFIGTFLEELISPIPSVLVMVPAGVAAQAQGDTLWFLVWLAVIASVGRMIAGTALYFAADKLEDVIFAKGRKFFGVTHKQVENFGKMLSKKHAVRSWLILFGLSALPFLPTSALSLACGFIKIRYGAFITSNFLGSIINGFFYLYVGYAGLEAARLIARLELLGQILMAAIILLAAIWLVWKRHKKKSSHS